MEQQIIDAAEIGLFGDHYWNLSQYELDLQFKGARQRHEGWYELGLWMAWHIAAFSRGKLPNLEQTLQKFRAARRPVTNKPQDWREVRNLMAAHRTALAERASKSKPKATVRPATKPKRRRP